MFGRLLGWCTIYIHFRELLPLSGILPGAKFTLRPSLVFSYIGGITAVGVSQTLQHGTRKGIMELLLLVCTTCIRHGSHHVGIGPHSSLVITYIFIVTEEKTSDWQYSLLLLSLKGKETH